jgi:Na+/proline symporter
LLTCIALGSGILFSYPELATIAGVQGVVVYALASALPLLIFAALGPMIRRKCPDGFVLTEWTRERYGTVAMLYLSFMTLVTLFLYMVAELSAVGQVVNALTGLDGLPVIIVECAVTTIYTCKLSINMMAIRRKMEKANISARTSSWWIPNLVPDRRCPRSHGHRTHHHRHHHHRRQGRD